MSLESDARTQLERMVAASSAPALSTPEVDALMALAARPDETGYLATDQDLWAATHVYAIDDELVPTTRNGHKYKITVAGTSDATEPTFPTTSGGTVTDNGVTYAENGNQTWAPTYDLEAAAAEGWRWKAARVAADFDFKTGPQSFDRSQRIAQLLKMADYYQARAGQSYVGGASIPVERGGITVVMDKGLYGPPVPRFLRHDSLLGVETNAD